ncbi:hypothetical protein DD565_14800 [Vibrio cholerae]|uniref:hypothetical protein n=1 Tax=Vibrio TaxID=662 RepID=UPI000D5D7060|nr:MULTISPECIES: hypothetical protein [Vibrio]MBN8090883.1 hypothetical protein [Vibrio vulnificus]MBN8119553.1 hypothetical protein [Vibrio vulnificus]MCU8120341.1 hypothetical protein [Vibrio vulnificus]PVX16468.1 hypothetical protein DD565_14800 [Vibrio cholerae]HDV5412820.1 hypothetical protein [Vibrio cholerae]
MEVSSSAISGALKAGVQVVSAQKRPVLEVYHRIHHLKHPPRDVTPHDEPSRVIARTSLQQVFISFTLTNIGGERAENIKLTIGGNMIRPTPKEDFGPIFKNIYPQMPPAGSVHLFCFDEFDFEWQLDAQSKQKYLEIIMEYDLPKGFVNTIRSLPWKITNKRRYSDKYLFYPFMVAGELPPPEYV